MATISNDYRRLQQQLHEDPNYGVASVQYAPIVEQVLLRYNERDLLDYGAGKGRLRTAIEERGLGDLVYTPFDPARPGWDARPRRHPAVACIDVLEHIEPEYLDAVLEDLSRVTGRVGVFTVHTGPAREVLADGRNAHLIQKSSSWWIVKLLGHFELKTFQTLGDTGFFVVVEPLK